MADDRSRVESDRQAILDAQSRGFGAKLLTYTRLSGPGWLQGAITLGGGSLAGSLYLGVIGGYEMLWLQPMMMIFGIVMLSAIGYVALSTEESPFRGINRHVNPVLGWGWAIATLLANLVWAMPQFSLGTAALEQNLLPGVIDPVISPWVFGGALFAVGFSIVLFYESGGWGIKLFEILLKLMVGVVVLSFFGVVVAMSMGEEGLAWSEIWRGFVPDFSLLSAPAKGFADVLARATRSEYWRDVILGTQRDRMIAAAATAVGINMTFLLPFSLLKRGWNRDFRGMATFDLSLGLFIPFVLATSCVVIASGSQFHAKFDPALLGDAEMTPAVSSLVGSYEKNLDGYLKAQLGADAFDVLADAEKTAVRLAIPRADRELAAMLVGRDASHLAGALERLTGKGIAQYVFGIGVLGMAISTIIILMLINGFTICEMLGLPSKGLLHAFGCLLPGLSGLLGFIYLWGDADARFWLAVPTSVFGMVLLPIAYIAFFLMMNSRPLLGDDLPRGGKRLAINFVMLLAIAAASIGAFGSIQGRKDSFAILGWQVEVRWAAAALLGVFAVAAIAAHFAKRRSRA